MISSLHFSSGLRLTHTLAKIFTTKIQKPLFLLSHPLQRNLNPNLIILILKSHKANIFQKLLKITLQTFPITKKIYVPISQRRLSKI